MINRWFPNASIVSPFEPSGISNVIQAAQRTDILFVRAKSEDQLNSLLEKNLPSDFKGLIVSPFRPSQNSLNFSIKTLSEMQKIEDSLIEEFYPRASKFPKVIGITGTNGKTSSCWFCMEIGKAMGVKVLYMGTIGVFLNGDKQKEKILTTTPSYLDLRKLIHKFSSRVDVIALEVSSHALSQSRLRGVSFDSIAWTNFTQDHLDFHGTMESYFEAKLELTKLATEKTIIVPSCEQQASLRERIGKSFDVTPTKSLNEYCKNVGNQFDHGFMRDNLEVALTCMLQVSGTSDQSIDLSNVTSPPGRLQAWEDQGITFVVDYAHTPDALEKLLCEVRRIYTEELILTVFGCGGDRDKRKRPLMGKVAKEKSDVVFVTSDNPRSENPEAIIDDIDDGSGGFIRESDRRLAISKAIDFAKSKLKEGKKPIVLIAGKGDEDYQEINGVRYPFSDEQVAKELSS